MNESRRRRIRDRSSGNATLISEGCKITGVITGNCDFQVSESVLALESDGGVNDVVFMDIDKEGYLDAMPVIERKLRPGGLLLVDNVLWDGRVLDEADNSASTASIRRFNKYLANSKHWQYVVNPLRDGLGVARLTSTPV